MDKQQEKKELLVRVLARSLTCLILTLLISPACDKSCRYRLKIVVFPSYFRNGLILSNLDLTKRNTSVQLGWNEYIKLFWHKVKTSVLKGPVFGVPVFGDMNHLCIKAETAPVCNLMPSVTEYFLYMLGRTSAFAMPLIINIVENTNTEWTGR